MKSSVRSPTSMSCCSVQDAAYFLMSWTLALVLGSASIISEHMRYVSWNMVMLLLSLGFTKRQPSFTFFVIWRYSLSDVTGHILLICPSSNCSVFISLAPSLFLNPFLAKNDECGWRMTEFLSVNRQKILVPHASVKFADSPAGC